MDFLMIIWVMLMAVLTIPEMMEDNFEPGLIRIIPAVLVWGIWYKWSTERLRQELGSGKRTT